MTRQPKRQRDNRESRIGKTACGKYRAASDEEIRDTMNSTISIDYTVSRIVVHPSSAEEVMRAVEPTGVDQHESRTLPKL